MTEMQRIVFPSKEASGEWRTIFSASCWTMIPVSEFERKGHTILNHLYVFTEMFVIGSTSSVVASLGHTFSSLSDLFHEKALRTVLPPLWLALIQKPSNIHLCCLPLTK